MIHMCVYHITYNTYIINICMHVLYNVIHVWIVLRIRTQVHV